MPNLLETALSAAATNPECTPELLAALRANVEDGLMVPYVCDGVPGFILAGDGRAAIERMQFAAMEIRGHG